MIDTFHAAVRLFRLAGAATDFFFGGGRQKSAAGMYSHSATQEKRSKCSSSCSKEFWFEPRASSLSVCFKAYNFTDLWIDPESPGFFFGFPQGIVTYYQGRAGYPQGISWMLEGHPEVCNKSMRFLLRFRVEPCHHLPSM